MNNKNQVMNTFFQSASELIKKNIKNLIIIFVIIFLLFLTFQGYSFYKINKSRGDSKSSVGLGLSIASDIVRSHGGNIALGKSPQSGLRIKISFPF